MDATPNLFYSNSLSLYNKYAEAENIFDSDITNCVWPTFHFQDTNCSFNLPKFSMNFNYKIPVGANVVRSKYEFTPYIHCTNSMFMFSVYDKYNATYTPAWVDVNIVNKTVIIDSSLVPTTIKSYSLIFNAVLVPHSITNIYNNNYSTGDTEVLFEFTNSQLTLIGYKSSTYLVAEKIQTFLLQFNDNENDKVIIYVYPNEHVKTFIQSIYNSSSSVNLILQSNIATNQSTEIILNYTDIYHQDASDFKNITFKVNLFSIEPPQFAKNLSIFKANKWSDFIINFPDVIDPNGLNWWIILEQPVPIWVTQNSANSILLKTSDLNFDFTGTINITVKVENEQNAWTEYNQTIVVEELKIPHFDIINNITFNESDSLEFSYNFEGNFEVHAIDWATNLTISWINLNHVANKIIISLQRMDSYQWAKLKSYNSWGNAIFSNEFSINSNSPNLIMAWNTFEPLIMFVGEEKLFLIPNDIFISKGTYKLLINLLSWNVNYKVKFGLEKSKEDVFIFASSNHTNNWNISLAATNSFNQSAETTINLLIK